MSVKAAFNVVKSLAASLKSPSSKPLTRDEFTKVVLQRALGYCACCSEKATTAHQIMDRRLFPDDGYRLDNGVALCDKHHKFAQATLITVEELRDRAKIKELAIPPGLKTDTCYDRWGNVIASPSMLILGPLMYEPAMQQALIAAGKQAIIYEALPHMIDEVKDDPERQTALTALKLSSYARELQKASV